VSFSLSAQGSVKVGDTFTIGEVAKDQYKYIKFPKANIVNKRGGVVDFNRLVGKSVEVTAIKEDKKGNTIATIKLVSGKRFFKSHMYVKVQIDDAIKNKELQAK
jgi:hypothetical protein